VLSPNVRSANTGTGRPAHNAQLESIAPVQIRSKIALLASIQTLAQVRVHHVRRSLSALVEQTRSLVELMNLQQVKLKLALLLFVDLTTLTKKLSPSRARTATTQIVAQTSFVRFVRRTNGVLVRLTALLQIALVTNTVQQELILIHQGQVEVKRFASTGNSVLEIQAPDLMDNAPPVPTRVVQIITNAIPVLQNLHVFREDGQ